MKIILVINMTVYTTLDSMYKALGRQIESSLNKMADDVVKEAKEIIWREFYQQYTPKEGGYQRTYQLLNGCMHGRVVKSGNTYSIEIYMDDSTAKLGYDENHVYDVWLDAAAGWHGTVEQTEGRYWEALRDFTFDNWRRLLIKHGLNVV